LTDNIRAVRIITERIIKDIQTRFDTYIKYVRDGTPESMAKAIAARKQIEDWAVNDISFLLTECKRLQHDVSIYMAHIDEHAARHSCNDCAVNGKCFYAPGWGDVQRNSCLFWEPIQPKTVE